MKCNIPRSRCAKHGIPFKERGKIEDLAIAEESLRDHYRTPHRDQVKEVRIVLVGFSVANSFGRCGFQPHRARPYGNERHESSSAVDLSMNELIFPRQVYMEINSLSH